MAVGGAALAHSGATGVVKERMDAMVAMAEALAQAAATADSPPGAEFAAMARTCGVGHEDFRIETD
jgi:hypothetical protein